MISQLWGTGIGLFEVWQKAGLRTAVKRNAVDLHYISLCPRQWPLFGQIRGHLRRNLGQMRRWDSPLAPNLHWHCGTFPRGKNQVPVILEWRDPKRLKFSRRAGTDVLVLRIPLGCPCPAASLGEISIQGHTRFNRSWPGSKAFPRSHRALSPFAASAAKAESTERRTAPGHSPGSRTRLGPESRQDGQVMPTK